MEIFSIRNIFLCIIFKKFFFNNLFKISILLQDKRSRTVHINYYTSAIYFLMTNFKLALFIHTIFVDYSVLNSFLYKFNYLMKEMNWTLKSILSAIRWEFSPISASFPSELKSNKMMAIRSFIELHSQKQNCSNIFFIKIFWIKLLIMNCYWWIYLFSSGQ